MLKDYCGTTVMFCWLFGHAGAHCVLCAGGWNLKLFMVFTGGESLLCVGVEREVGRVRVHGRELD